MASKGILLVQNTPLTVVERMAEVIRNMRGVHKVEVNVKGHVGIVDEETGTYGIIENGWTSLYIRGTDLAVKKAAEVAGILAADDQNGDHDHQGCIERAAKMGVPASWAHMPETYLSM